jgi:2-iminobutanoate/2-iminopropanoate deaminase
LDKQILSPASLAEPLGPFVRGIRMGDLVAISGTSALSHLSGNLSDRHLDANFETQAALTFQNLHRALIDGGLDWDDVIKLTVMIKRRDDYADMNRIRSETIGSAQVASTTFVCELIRDDMLIEVDAWAMAEGDQGISKT